MYRGLHLVRLAHKPRPIILAEAIHGMNKTGLVWIKINIKKNLLYFLPPLFFTKIFDKKKYGLKFDNNTYFLSQ